MKKYIITIATLLFTHVTFGQGLDLVKDQVKKGNLLKALEISNSSSVKKNEGAENFFWQGRIFYILRDYKKSVESFRASRKMGFFNNKINFEYAQALYSLNELNRAKVYFLRDLSNNPENYRSHYYLGDISLLLEKRKTAKSHFEKVLSIKSSSLGLKQASLFQIASIEEEGIQEQKDLTKYVKEKVLPAYRRVGKLDSSTKVAKRANMKIIKLEEKYGLGPGRYASGLQIKRKRHRLRVAQEVGFDSNVLLIPDDISGAQAQNKSSFVSKTSLSGEYRFDMKKRFSIAPYIGFDFDQYFDREREAIFQNDQYRIHSMLKSQFHHKIINKPAFALFNLGYSLTEKDYLSIKDKKFYSRSYKVEAGELINFLKMGTSIIKASFEKTEFYSDPLKSKKYGLNYIQQFKLKNKATLMGIVGFKKNDVEDEVLSNTTYSLIGTYSDPLLPEKLGLASFKISFGGSLLLIDTEKQSSVRGLEKNISPFFIISRPLHKLIDLKFKYAFTKNLSKSEENFQYSKHNTSLTAVADF